VSDPEPQQDRASAHDPKPTGWRTLRRVARALVLLLLAGLMFRWFEHRQVYHPSRDQAATGAELGRPVEQVWLTAADGVSLHGWWFPPGPDAPHPDKAWLLLHGNAGNISHRLLHADLLLQTGAGAFLLDYRGYGRSEGRPSETGTYLDAEAAYDWLRQHGLAPTGLYAIGESLGGGVACELARRRTLGGLVLLSAFTSTADVAAQFYPWLPVHWLMSIRYDNLSKLPELTLPVLLLHGRQDSLIPFSHAERNYAAAREPKRLVALEGDHNDLPYSAASDYQAALKAMLQDAIRIP